jgi:predicted AAA+ superfamily ATPase
MKKLIERKEYTDRLRAYRDADLIKIATGIRRSGKSSIFQLFADELLASGIDKTLIHTYNLEQKELKPFLNNWEGFYDLIVSKLVKGKTNYVFVDEVQNIEDFEHFIDSLYVAKGVNLFITGSNAFLSSSEFATLLTGRYIDLSVYSFSFSEYLRARKIKIDPNSDLLASYFQQYLYGSTLPETVAFGEDNNAIHKYARTVYDDICEKDIYKRHKIKNKALFQKVARYLLDSVGSPVSVNNITEYLVSNKTDVTNKTVSDYIDYLCKSYVLYKAERFDVKGKKILATLPKYYLADPGFYYSVLGHVRGESAGHLLENVVYLELLKRGKNVFVGKIYDNEIDFVAQNLDGSIEYYQVALTVADMKTKQRELSSFDKLRDNYPKILLTTDTFTANVDGYDHHNVFKWLLGDK